MKLGLMQNISYLCDITVVCDVLDFQSVYSGMSDFSFDQGKGQALTSVDIKIAMQVIDDEAHLVCLLSHHYAHVTGGTVSALPSPGSAAAPEDVKKSMLKTV